MYGEIGLRRCLDAAVGASAYGDDLPTTRRSASPSVVAELPRSVRCVHQDRQRRLRDDHHWRPRVRYRFGHDPADARGEGVGHGARGFPARLSGHVGGPVRRRATGSQTLLNNGRAVVEAAREVAAQLRDLAADQLEAAPDDIVLEGGQAHVSGRPTRPSRSSSWPDRRRRRDADRPKAPHTAGISIRVGDVCRRPRSRRLGGAPVRLPCRSRPPRSRDRRGSGPRCLGCPRLRNHHQSRCGARPGRGWDHDGRRSGAHRGHAVRRRREAAKHRPARVQAADCGRRANDPHRVHRDPGSERRTPVAPRVWPRPRTSRPPQRSPTVLRSWWARPCASCR